MELKPTDRRPRIGSLVLESPLILAPMAGITNMPMRRLAREAGCGLVYSEMVSANGLLHRPAETLAYLGADPAEKPLAVQLFGADPPVLAEAAAALVEAGAADIIDINMGCAVRKVVHTGAGVALMRAPERAAALLQAVRRAVRIPLTIKIRSGWDRTGAQALAIGAMAQDCGVDAVALHPRTAAQRFSGQADWSIIAALKRRLGIPVIGNGDVVSPEIALQMFAETGCDAVMIGRKAVGYPQIFTQIALRLAGRPLPAEDTEVRLDLMRRYLTLSVACLGEACAARLMRQRLGWFLKGLAHSAGLKQHLSGGASIAQCADTIEDFRREWRRRGPPG